MTQATPLDTSRTLEVLASLDGQLGPVDPDARALVALTPGEADNVALTPIELRDDGVLEAPDGTLGIVVVTSEDVRLDDNDEVVQLRQLVAILPDGTEAGIVRLGSDDSPRTWASDDPATTDDDTASAEGLRPRDVTANTARRALGLPSLADVPPVEDLLARAWLLLVAEEGLTRFDSPDGPREVEPEELAHLGGADPLSGLCSSGADDEDERIPTWEEVRACAAAGELQLARFTVDPTHAGWLDADGFAQVVDRTLPSTEQLLGTIRVLGEDPLVGWAIDHIAERGWGRPL